MVGYASEECVHGYVRGYCGVGGGKVVGIQVNKYTRHGRGNSTLGKSLLKQTGLTRFIAFRGTYQQDDSHHPARGIVTAIVCLPVYLSTCIPKPKRLQMTRVKISITFLVFFSLACSITANLPIPTAAPPNHNCPDIGGTTNRVRAPRLKRRSDFVRRRRKDRVNRLSRARRSAARRLTASLIR